MIYSEAILRATTQWGTSANAKPMSAIAYEMILSETGRQKFLKARIIKDMSFVEAVEEACIKIGLSSEDFAPSLVDQGDQVELSLY